MIAGPKINDPAAGHAGASDPAVADPAIRDRAVAVQRMTQRADYLRTAQALRQGTPAFLLQARARGASAPAAPPHPAHDGPAHDAARVGLTCSKKIGNAVARNRAKRRLRALVRAVMPQAAQPGWDYVLVGRPETTATRPFAQMQADLARALAHLHAKAPPSQPPAPPPAPPVPEAAP